MPKILSPRNLFLIGTCLTLASLFFPLWIEVTPVRPFWYYSVHPLGNSSSNPDLPYLQGGYDGYLVALVCILILVYVLFPRFQPRLSRWIPTLAGALVVDFIFNLVWFYTVRQNSLDTYTSTGMTLLGLGSILLLVLTLQDRKKLPAG